MFLRVDKRVLCSSGTHLFVLSIDAQADLELMVVAMKNIAKFSQCNMV
jgi:hypothetical protein